MKIRNCACATAFLALTFTAVSAMANRYTLVDLGHLDVVSMNQHGAVVANGANRGEIYFNGKTRNLPRHSVPRSINRSKDVVGYVWSTSHAYYWPHNGDTVQLVMPDDSLVAYTSILNDSGEVFGTYGPAGVNAGCFAMSSPTSQALDFTPAGYTECMVFDLNNLGQATGEAHPYPSKVEPFIWSNGIYQALPMVPHSTGGWGLAINDAGNVAGLADVNGGNISAALWTSTEGINLDPKGEYYYSEADSINNHGEIVGYTKEYESADPVAVRFAHLKVVKLSSEVENLGGWQLQTAVKVNDKGEIVGDGVIDTDQRGYMLLPVKR